MVGSALPSSGFAGASAVGGVSDGDPAGGDTGGPPGGGCSAGGGVGGAAWLGVAGGTTPGSCASTKLPTKLIEIAASAEPHSSLPLRTPMTLPQCRSGPLTRPPHPTHHHGSPSAANVPKPGAETSKRQA